LPSPATSDCRQRITRGSRRNRDTRDSRTPARPPRPQGSASHLTFRCGLSIREFKFSRIFRNRRRHAAFEARR
jgi:hypothetical protein